MSGETGDTGDRASIVEVTESRGGRLSPLAPEASRGGAYLLVLEQDSSEVFELPQSGTVVIGRARDADLRVKDPSVSRHHARVAIVNGEAEVSDLGSQNGTFVNDERIGGPRALVSGDVLSLCGTTLVYTSSQRPKCLYAVVGLPELRRRVEAELDRSLRQRTSVTLAVAALGAPDVERARVLGALEARLRMSDIVAWGAPDQLLVVMPDTGADEAPEVCARLLDLLTPVTPAIRLGWATCPGDGADLNALLAGARAATTRAGPGSWAPAAEAYRSVQIGARTIVLADPATVRVFGLVERLSSTDLSILVGGETGTGKEVVAQALHHWSPRRDGPFVAVNCAAIQENLFESELFGHERGSFSGAVSSRVGLVESASGGTLFLDEVGELPLMVQAKLLRVLEDKKVTRVGDVRARDVDVRIVAASNRDLEREVGEGRFRRDLFFRLSGGKIWLPPLRDRKRELVVLAQLFLAEACAATGRPTVSLSDSALRALSAHDWPGNVRELRNLIEYLVATAIEPIIDEPAVAERLGQAPPRPPGVEAPVAHPDGAGARAFRPIEEELRSLERTRIAEALEAASGNRTRAAELISMPLRTFMRKLEQYGLAGRRGTS